MTEDLRPETPTVGRAEDAIHQAEKDLSVSGETAGEVRFVVSVFNDGEVIGPVTPVRGRVPAAGEDWHYALETRTYRRLTDEEAARLISSSIPRLLSTFIGPE